MSRPRQWQAALFLALTISAAPCSAHFTWLASDDAGHALLFFGETPYDRTYKVPDCVANAHVDRIAADNQAAAVELPIVEDDENFLGRRSAEAVAGTGVVQTSCKYGVYHGMLLTYHAKHLLGHDPAKWLAVDSQHRLRLDAQPKLTDKGLEIAVAWDGKPLVDAKVTVMSEDGDLDEAQTNDAGIAEFNAPARGLVGVLVEHMDSKATGESDGQKYTSAGDYGSLTFWAPGSSDAAAPKDKSASKESDSVEKIGDSGFPNLPEPVASFGAAVADGWLYIYSGHIGKQHAHSRDNLSNHFRRVKLDGGQTWEELPMQTPLQGLPLVSHAGKLYRVGGLSARNAKGKAADLYSQSEVAAFDPATKTWTALPSLPEPRSSHDAAVLGHTLYVVGGWQINGGADGQWLETAWSLDLATPGAQWTKIPAPPFHRRAMALASWEGKLVALGGMDENTEILLDSFAFDPATGAWTSLPTLPGDGMDGFGISAWGVADSLYASSADGSLWRLRPGDKQWTKAAALATPRFFHRLVPQHADLLAVGGASIETGHLTSLELVPLTAPKN